VLLEFIAGCSFRELDLASSRHLFGHELDERGKTRLRELGRLLALDAVLNNSDRLPLMWNNQGNAGNIMASSVFYVFQVFVDLRISASPASMRSSCRSQKIKERSIMAT
jgi:hypothetical protein